MGKAWRLFKWVLTNWRSITWARVQNFFEAKYRQHTADDIVMEQYYWREKEVARESPECILSGKCKKCGCEIPDKFFESAECESGCYPEWMEPEEWQEFKKKNQISFELK